MLQPIVQQQRRPATAAATGYVAPFPFKVTWDLTHRCNLRCRHCFVIFQQQASPGPAERERDLRIAESICSARPFVVSIAGGEPFLVPHLPLLAERFVADGAEVIIATNGTIHDEAALARLARLPRCGLQVSLDGACAETHDRLRGSGAYARTRAFLERCAGGIPVTIAVTLTEDACREVPAIVELGRRLGARAVKLQPFIRAPSVPEPGRAASPQSLAEAARQLAERARTVPPPPVVLHPFEHIAATAGLRSLRTAPCAGVGLRECTVLPGGALALCGATLDTCATLGNLLDMPLRTLWPHATARTLHGRGALAGSCACDL